MFVCVLSITLHLKILPQHVRGEPTVGQSVRSVSRLKQLRTLTQAVKWRATVWSGEREMRCVGMPAFQ